MPASRYETLVRAEIAKLGEAALKIPVGDAAVTAAALAELRGKAIGLEASIQLYKRSARADTGGDEDE